MDVGALWAADVEYAEDVLRCPSLLEETLSNRVDNFPNHTFTSTCPLIFNDRPCH